LILPENIHTYQYLVLKISFGCFVRVAEKKKMEEKNSLQKNMIIANCNCFFNTTVKIKQFGLMPVQL
jgi:hypothetical protein